MPRGVKKEHLPVKTCVVCQRPFNWRKKWEKVWDEVTTCSKSCNRQRRTQNQRERRRQNNDDDNASGVVSLSSLPNDQSVGSDNEADDNLSWNSSVNAALANLDVHADEISPTTANEDSVSEQDAMTLRQSNHDNDNTAKSDNENPLDPRAARKAAKKAKKAARRAQRQGRADPSVGQKLCHVCGKSVDLLIRCTTDASGEWRMVCGKCWHTVSGSVIDGSPNHPHYRYGGLWKNRAKR